MKKSTCILLIGALTIIGCKREPVQFINPIDYEPVWFNVHTVHPFENARSGNLVSVTDTLAPYSFGFAGVLKDINEKPLRKGKITVWVYVKNNNAKGTLVIRILSGDQNAGWIGVNFDSQNIKPNVWKQLSAEIAIPDTISETAVVKAYVWNQSKEKVYVDDIDVVFE